MPCRWWAGAQYRPDLAQLDRAVRRLVYQLTTPPRLCGCGCLIVPRTDVACPACGAHL